MRVARAQQLADAHGGPGGLGNFRVAAHEVGVGVGFDNGHNAGVVGLGEVVVGLRVAGRVHQHDFAGFLAQNGAGKIGQTRVFKLFDLYDNEWVG